jgi:cyanate lyase
MRRTVVIILGIFITGIWLSTPAFAAITSTAEDAIAQESYDQRKPTLDIANKAAAQKKETLESLSKACGVMIIRIGSVLAGQAPLEKKLQECLEKELGLSSGTLNPLNAPPVRWNTGAIYRIHEATDVYGPAIQRWMNEHFGDTIMSAISFTVEVEEGKSHGQKTIKIILEGKALSYSDDAYWTKE